MQCVISITEDLGFDLGFLSECLNAVHLSGRRWRLQRQRRLQQRLTQSLHRRQPCRLRRCSYLSCPLRLCSLPRHWPEQLTQRLQQQAHSLQAPVQTQDRLYSALVGLLDAVLR